MYSSIVYISLSSCLPIFSIFSLSYLEKYPYANVRQEVSTHLCRMKVRFLLTSYDKLHQFHEHRETTCKYTYTGDSWGVISLKLGNFPYSPTNHPTSAENMINCGILRVSDLLHQKTPAALNSMLSGVLTAVLYISYFLAAAA